MPRQSRLQYPGAMYHVMSRGNQRKDIFVDDVDRQDFLKTMAEACQKTGMKSENSINPAQAVLGF
jgi:REP element-mobilizing transposase RayT